MRFAKRIPPSLRLPLVLCLSVAAGMALFFIAPVVNSQPWNAWARDRAIDACGQKDKADIQIECIFDVLTGEMETHGVAATMEAFTRAYEKFPEFVSGGCHRQAHRVGDLAYYHRYVGEEDMERIDLPQSTTACGYGFYHGFLEHLIQDHPDPNFVDEICTYLTNRVGSTMGSIRITCYHGAGHGFMLAHIETLGEKDWGNFRKFTEAPTDECRKLRLADAADIEQCLEGVYNVLVDAMELKEYGFSYDYAHPFRQCDTVSSRNVAACYYEMSQKLDRASSLDPVALDRLAGQGIKVELQDLAFRVGIAGIVQQIIVKGGQHELIAQCGALADKRFTECLQSTINGLYEHGLPQQEYKKALEACGEEVIGKRGQSKLCYTTVAWRLPRFYGDERIAQICREFPDAYREVCEAQIGKHANDE